MTDLEQLRAEIEATDMEILRLMRRRLELAGLVGEYKMERGRPVLDRSSEERVISRYRTFASENGMDPDNAEAVCELLMRESKDVQSSLHREALR
ncbi:MAG: chorismate mutase [Candidatus Methanomethylophilaceae archaeon]|jgi:chorismate mutase|nr:chorismate mutase [Candidatus Methanomethylophilaceae archaeon]NLF34135.1 chorismate mutase [Thermoplasmatales archaeon]